MSNVVADPATSTVYLGVGHKLYALDATSGRTRWHWRDDGPALALAKAAIEPTRHGIVVAANDREAKRTHLMILSEDGTVKRDATMPTDPPTRYWNNRLVVRWPRIYLRSDRPWLVCRVMEK